MLAVQGAAHRGRLRSGIFQVASYCSYRHLVDAAKEHEKECAFEAAIDRALALESIADRPTRPVPARATCAYCGGRRGELFSQGCECRGTAGFAHVACAFETTKDKIRKRDVSGCHVCDTSFTGHFALRLAAAYWRMHRRRRRLFGRINTAQQRLAMDQLSFHFTLCKETGAALKMRQDLVEDCRLHCPHTHPMLYTAAHGLACVYLEKKFYAQVRDLLGPLSNGWRTATDEQDRKTRLNVVWCYAESLKQLHDYRQAETFFRLGMQVAARQVGEGSLGTLSFGYSLALTLGCQERWADAREAASICFVKHLRFLGPDHPSTIDAKNLLAILES